MNSTILWPHDNTNKLHTSSLITQPQIYVSGLQSKRTGPDFKINKLTINKVGYLIQEFLCVMEHFYIIITLILPKVKQWTTATAEGD